MSSEASVARHFYWHVRRPPAPLRFMEISTGTAGSPDLAIWRAERGCRRHCGCWRGQRVVRHRD